MSAILAEDMKNEETYEYSWSYLRMGAGVEI